MKNLTTLLEGLRAAQKRDRIIRVEGEENIKVHHMTSAVASFYEKMRTFLDYNEEHLLRKNAIYRILKRRKLLEGDHRKIAEHLIKELISARYIENNKLPESRIDFLALIIQKYSELFSEVTAQHGIKGSVANYDWIMQMAACEVEESLVPHHTEKVFIRFLYAQLQQRIEIDDDSLSPTEKELLLYVAVNRSLIKSDKAMLEYLALNLYYPQWLTDYRQVLTVIASDIEHIQTELLAPIDHVLSNKLLKAVQPFATKISILQKVIFENLNALEALTTDEEFLRHQIETMCAAKYKDTRLRVARSSLRSIIYILITKVLLALLIEVPFDKYVLGEFNWLSVAVNITFPPLLMFTIALSTRTPGSKNTEAIRDGILAILYGRKEEIVHVRPPKARSTFTRVLFNTAYALAFIIPFVAIMALLRQIDFSYLSILLFIVFMSIVSFFGVRIRRTAKELLVLKQRENFFTELFDFFTFPLVQFGRWMSLNFSKINVFVFIMDFIIEAPLKLLLQVFEEWMGFVREKKEDMD